MSGSLATTSMRKPSGNLNAAALSSGVIGLGASAGFGICARARFNGNNRTDANAANLRAAGDGFGKFVEISSCEMRSVAIGSSYRLQADFQYRPNAAKIRFILPIFLSHSYRSASIGFTRVA